MKTTLRLPDALAEQATAYADSLGISLNALCAVALRDYLNQRPTPAPVRSASAVAHPAASERPSASVAGIETDAAPAAAGMSTAAGAEGIADSLPVRAPAAPGASIEAKPEARGVQVPRAVSFVPQVHPRQPCPCGSGKLYGKCCRGKS